MSKHIAKNSIKIFLELEKTHVCTPGKLIKKEMKKIIMIMILKKLIEKKENVYARR